MFELRTVIGRGRVSHFVFDRTASDVDVQLYCTHVYVAIPDSILTVAVCCVV